MNGKIEVFKRSKFLLTFFRPNVSFKNDFEALLSFNLLIFAGIFAIEVSLNTITNCEIRIRQDGSFSYWPKQRQM